MHYMWPSELQHRIICCIWLTPNSNPSENNLYLQCRKKLKKKTFKVPRYVIFAFALFDNLFLRLKYSPSASFSNFYQIYPKRQQSTTRLRDVTTQKATT
jgi:hypothetical protein